MCNNEKTTNTEKELPSVVTLKKKKFSFQEAVVV